MNNNTVQCLLIGGPHDGQVIIIPVTIPVLRLSTEEEFGEAYADSVFPHNPETEGIETLINYKVSILTDNLQQTKQRSQVAIAYTEDVQFPLKQALTK